MLLCEVTFGKFLDRNKFELYDIAENYLDTLYKHSQIIDYIISEIDTEIKAYVKIPLPNSYNEKYLSKWGRYRLEEVFNGFENKPTWKVLSHNIEDEPPKWETATYLYLYTFQYLDFEQYSPIFIGGTDVQVPVYLLPFPDNETNDRAWTEDLYCWASSYRAYDKIWVGSGTLENQAYKELADPKSELNESGRELCNEIEAFTKIPTYY